MTVFARGELDRLAACYPQRPGKLCHDLSGHPLLTLEALVELGQEMPAADVEYNAGDLPIGVDPDAVARTGLSVEETIRGIEQCGSWMVLKHVERNPAYRALLDEVLAGAGAGGRAGHRRDADPVRASSSSRHPMQSRRSTWTLSITSCSRSGAARR